MLTATISSTNGNKKYSTEVISTRPPVVGEKYGRNGELSAGQNPNSMRADHPNLKNPSRRAAMLATVPGLGTKEG